MDRDKAKVELKEVIGKLFDSDEYTQFEDNRSGFIGDETISFMAEAALSVLLGIEDTYDYMRKEGMINGIS